MNRRLMLPAAVLASLLLVQTHVCAQTTGMVGAKMGLSLVDGNAGFLIGPGGEVIFKKNYGVGTELNISTQGGTPVDWTTYFKYIVSIRGSKIRPYADGGISLAFYTGGPYFGLRFGGGALFEVAKQVNIMGDLQFGPTFGGGTGVFVLQIAGGIRYEIR